MHFISKTSSDYKDHLPDGKLILELDEDEVAKVVEILGITRSLDDNERYKNSKLTITYTLTYDFTDDHKKWLKETA